MKTTIDSATRWRLVVHKFKKDFPVSEKEESEGRYIVENGISSLSIDSSKSDPNAPCTITVTGDIPSCFFIGNWVIVKSKKGSFISGKDHKEGITRFIGQITDVVIDYQKDAVGTFRRQAMVTMRPWSTMLQVPIRYDLASAAREYDTATANVIGHVASKIDKNGSTINKLHTLAEKIFNPWEYAALVLKFIGALNKSTEGNLISTLPGFAAAAELVKSFPDVAVKMPYIPHSILEDVGAANSTSDDAFTTGSGFVEQLFGVVKYGVSHRETCVALKIPNAFDGVWQGRKISDSYEATNDRPIITNIGAEFSQGGKAWELLTQKLDPSCEAYCTLVYTGQGKEIIGKPAIVIRDKPFALRTMWEAINGSSPFVSKWTKFDDLPRVGINSALIKRVKLHSTLMNSPNYVLPQIIDSNIRDSGVKSLALQFGRIRLGKEMGRFGGIEDFYFSTFGVLSKETTQSDGADNVNIKWFTDVANMNYLWKCIDYRFLRGTMQIFDNNTLIVVGDNITFTLGKNNLCAHVEAVSWQHSISPNGMKSTSCNIEISHVCKVDTEGRLGLLGPTAFNDIFESEATDEYTITVSTPGLPDLSSFLEGLEVTKKAKEAAAKAKEAWNTAKEALSKLPF